MELYTKKETLKDENGVFAVLSFTLPKVKNAHRFNKYYEGVAESFKGFATTRLCKPPLRQSDAPVGLVLNTVVSTESRGVISLYVDASVSGGGTPRRRRIGATWDMRGDVLLPYAALFNCGKKKLLPLLVAEAERKSQGAAVALYPDYKTRLSRFFDKKNFYISPRSAVFFYQGGVLNEKNAPFALPLSEEAVRPLMKSLLWED